MNRNPQGGDHEVHRFHYSDPVPVRAERNGEREAESRPNLVRSEQGVRAESRPDVVWSDEGKLGQGALETWAYEGAGSGDPELDVRAAGVALGTLGDQ
jgi:hypothetical protein